MTVALPRRRRGGRTGRGWTEDQERCQAAGVPADVEFATSSPWGCARGRSAARDRRASGAGFGNIVFTDVVSAPGVGFGPGVFCRSRGPPGGWDHEVRTEVKRTRLVAFRRGTSSHPAGGVDPASPRDGRKPCSWVTAGGQTRRTNLARSLFRPNQPAPGRRTGKTLAGGGTGPGDAEPYHGRGGASPPASHQSSLPQAEPLPLADIEHFNAPKMTWVWTDFEGRSWRGFHHHLVLSAVAYLFILTVYLRRKKNFWCDVGNILRDPALACVDGSGRCPSAG